MSASQAVAQRALGIRRNVVRMAAGKGEGYVGQGLQAADILACLFFSEMDWDPHGTDPAGDRFLLSTGHYSIALWGALAEAGAISAEQLDDYGADGSTLPMSTERGRPVGVELTSGSLAQGLSVASGIAVARRMKGHSGRVFNYMTDGEVQEGSTWEAAMFAGDRGLGSIVNLVDVNRTQADGPLVLEVEPLAEKFRSFGWWAADVDGNDVEALLEVLEEARAERERPKAIVCHTQIGFGVPFIAARDRAHFVRVDPHEWTAVAAELEESA